MSDSPSSGTGSSGPVSHRVQGNDHISFIAVQAGYEELKEIESANATLKGERKTLHILFHGDRSEKGKDKGDVVRIPEVKTKDVDGAADAHHPFKIGPAVLFLPLRVLDEDRKPLADAPIELYIDGVKMKPTKLDGNGSIKVGIQKHAQVGKLIVTLPPDPAPATAPAPAGGAAPAAPAPPPAPPKKSTFMLHIGRLDPIHGYAPDADCTAGAQQRLNNLGYDAGNVDGICGARTRFALWRFQEKFDVKEEKVDPKDGKKYPYPGPKTLAALLKYHDRATPIPATKAGVRSFGQVLKRPKLSGKTMTAPTATAATPAGAAAAKNLSGTTFDWVAWSDTNAADSKATADLEEPFKTNFGIFKEMLEDAGAVCNVTLTKRSDKRAYLCHWAWKIAKGDRKSAEIPPMEGVDIDWVHKDDEGKPDEAKSKKAAEDMAAAFGVDALRRPPLLTDHYVRGQSADMTVTWAGTITLYRLRKHSAALVASLAALKVSADSVTENVTSNPKDASNPDLIRIARSYKVYRSPVDAGTQWYHGT
jgi:Putative peptidoglycan binding domain